VSADLTPARHGRREAVESLLEVRDLRVTRKTALGRRSTILSGVDLSIAPGEAIGVVGESGSGKSMTARAIVRLLPQSMTAAGEVRYDGRNLLEVPERAMTRVRGNEIGLVFQDPFTMLDPLVRCGRHIEESLRAGSTHRRSRDLRTEVRTRLAEVGIDDPMVAQRYPFELSGGMRQRVGIASMLARNPRLLIADEPATALDVTTQKEVLALLKELQRSRGMGLMLITHDLRVAVATCDRIYVLYAGSVIEVGPSTAVQQEPNHPYTLGLFISEPPSERRVDEFMAMEGSVPNPDDVADCCTFAPRCGWVADSCRSGQPPLRPVEAGRSTACLRFSVIQPEMAATRKRAVRPGGESLSPTRDHLLVSTDEVRKVFKTGRGLGSSQRVVAVDGVSIEVGVGESVGLVGESGSGKTTLGRCIAGLEKVTSGTITIDSLDATSYQRLSAPERRRLRRTVQMIFQDPYSTLNPARTVGQPPPAFRLAGSGRPAGRLRGAQAGRPLRRGTPAGGDRPGARRQPPPHHLR
jgi:peptide/nickel transport system ATP-binding protein